MTFKGISLKIKREVIHMKKEAQKHISITVPQELYEQLKALAAENCYPLSGYIRQTLKVHIQNLRK